MNRLRKNLFWLGLFAIVSPVRAATRGELHLAVYSAGFLVDTQRQVTYDDQASRSEVTTRGQGTAKGETPGKSIVIDRLDSGMAWILDPRTRTYHEERYQPSFTLERVDTASGTVEPPTLVVSAVDTQRSVALATATINGVLCKAYTIRLVAKFANAKTGTVIATETLLEKLWVAENAPEAARFRDAEKRFDETLQAKYRTEKADFRWLLREFNRTFLELNGRPEDFKTIQQSYRDARAQIKGVTIRQLAGWNWRTTDPMAPDATQGDDIHAFVASIASGLGAPPDAKDKPMLSETQKPAWVRELSRDLGRTGPSAMMLNELIHAQSAKVSPEYFTVPVEYRKQ
jgi:hypothetical protein